MAGNTIKGHLLEVSSRIENSSAVALGNRLLRNTNLIADNDALTNQWIGLTDTDDLSIPEAGTSKMTGWYWAGTTGGKGPGGLRHIENSRACPMASGLKGSKLPPCLARTSRSWTFPTLRQAPA